MKETIGHSELNINEDLVTELVGWYSKRLAGPSLVLPQLTPQEVLGRLRPDLLSTAQSGQLEYPLFRDPQASQTTTSVADLLATVRVLYATYPDIEIPLTEKLDYLMLTCAVRTLHLFYQLSDPEEDSDDWIYGPALAWMNDTVNFIQLPLMGISPQDVVRIYRTPLHEYEEEYVEEMVREAQTAGGGSAALIRQLFLEKLLESTSEGRVGGNDTSGLEHIDSLLRVAEKLEIPVSSEIVLALYTYGRLTRVDNDVYWQAVTTGPFERKLKAKLENDPEYKRKYHEAQKALHRALNFSRQKIVQLIFPDKNIPNGGIGLLSV